MEHFSRVLKWKLSSIEPTTEESIHLGSPSEITPFFHYLLWRKASFVLTVLPAAISSLLEFVSLAELSKDEALRDTSGGLSLLDSFLLSALSICGWARWKEFSSTTLHWMFGVWILAFLLSLCPLLFGRHYFIWRLSQALPAILTLPYCAIRAAHRIHLLEPSFHLAKWFLFLLVPVYSVLVLLSLSAVRLLWPSGVNLLIVASVILAASPSLYILRNNLYMRPEGKDDAVNGNEVLIHTINFVGILIAVVWALMEKPIHVRDIFQLFFETTARVFITNAIVADLMVQASVGFLNAEKESGAEFHSRVEITFGPFDHAMHKREAGSGENLSKTSKRSMSSDIGEHNVFKDSVVDLESEVEMREKKKGPITDEEEGEIGHEVFGFDVE